MLFMAGIYIHIPFCGKKCLYCDFYSLASMKESGDFLKELKHEIILQKNYLGRDAVTSVYFGGGTPSLLHPSKITQILDCISSHHNLASGCEVTLEANPEDITEKYIRELIKTPVNRLSIGIQCFNDSLLKILNRRHNAGQGENALRIVLDRGYTNVSADLIYGLPGMTAEEWSSTLEKILSFNIRHLSAYILTTEPGTPLAILIEKGNLLLPDEADIEEQFGILVETTAGNGFIHYEISNFGKEGFFSGHNVACWKGEKYLGLGPSAHSFNGSTRQWNVSSISEYITALARSNLPCTVENIGKIQRYNEYVMTSLRTMWGADLEYIQSGFGKEYGKHCIARARKYVDSGLLKKSERCLALSKAGMMLSDGIIAELFMAG
ncbi:MAG: radical SAM family heme chaperone HemW [Bacteroidetes bacterium]|nr:radical SAM family heme chaperone HemW [Bacteroidota bacterium]